MENIILTNNKDLRLVSVKVGVLSTLRFELPLVSASATHVEVIVTSGDVHSAYTATFIDATKRWQCDIAASQFPAVGKQSYEVAYVLDGKQFWDGKGWIEIEDATTSGIEPQPRPEPYRYAVVSVNGYGADAQGAVRIPKTLIATDSPTTTEGYIEGDIYFNRETGATWTLCNVQGTLTWVAVEGVITFDDAVTRASANGVKSSGIWRALWGALSALPTGFSSLYDWCVSQLAGKMPSTATGANIPVDATQGAQKINAALAGKLDKSGGEMTGPLSAPQVNITREGYPTWSMELDSEVGRFHFKAPPLAGVLGSVDLALPHRTDNISGTVALTAANPTAGNLAALDANGNPTDSLIPAANVALTSAIPYILVTKTISNNAVTLDDRASNAVTISTTLSPNTLTINFPTAPTSGKVRDFAMRLNIAAGVTAPEIAWSQGVTLENNGGEVPEIADGGTGGSSTILYFSETENNGTTAKFLVKGETLTAIAQA